MSDFNRLLDRGDHLLEMKRPQEAIKEFQRALAITPEDPIALCYMAYSFLLLKRHDDSLDWAGRAIAASPHSTWAFRVKAHAHLGKDQRKSAYESATQAVALQPEDIMSLTLLGDCALALDRHEEVRVLAELVRKQAPESVNGHLLLAHLAEAEGKPADAAEHFEKVLELDSNNADALSSLASIRGRDNRFGESVDLMRGALSVDPTRQDRQSHFSDSMKRFAMFGEANQRRKSVGGLMVAIFAVYLGASIVATNFIDAPWLSQLIMFGLCPVMLLMIPLLRARFFAAQAQQIQLLQANLARLQRRRTLMATGVVIVVTYAIAGIAYRDTSDPFVFVMPLAIAAACFWIYMAAIALRLASLWLSDIWARMMSTRVPESKRGVPFAMKASLAIAIVALVVGLSTNHGGAWLVCLTASTVSAITFYGRFPAATSGVIAALGIAILVIDRVAGVEGDDGALGDFGLVLLLLGAACLLLWGAREAQKSWQRRRIGRLLSGERPGA